MGLVEEGFKVIRDDGGCVSLGTRRQLWNILISLFNRGSEATKEQLVLDVWKEQRYYPEQHDHRLHVGIRKLRGLIELSPSSPKRIITTRKGYALDGRIWRIVSS
jgi:DNA-binding winged helix-turn-helix (wHTH) protein